MPELSKLSKIPKILTAKLILLEEKKDLQVYQAEEVENKSESKDESESKNVNKGESEDKGVILDKKI
ncbi:12747_t:CDS:1, partial [Cetraspora pellucida]